jgi:hypothetical protein
VRRYQTSYLVEAHLAAGRIAEGLAAVREILVLPEGQLGGAFLDAELFRLEGELLRAAGDAAAAEASFRRALGIARRQGARAFELRAAARRPPRRPPRARGPAPLSTLTAIYETFDEGFVTRDLQEARELLERLSSL